MSVYQQFPRLYDQSGQGTTTNYYGGLNKSPTLSSYAGNQNVGKVGETPATGTVNTQPTTAPRPSYGTLGQQGDGSMGAYNLTPEQQARLNGRYLAGNAYDNGLIIDDSQLEYDDELGWMTGKDNIREDNSGLFRYGRLGNMALGAGFVLGGAGLANAAGLGAGSAGVTATDIAMPALTGAADTTLAAAPTITGGGAAASAAGLAGGTMPTIAAPAMEMPALTGAANPALSAAPNLNGGFPWSTAGRAALNIGGGLANWYLGNRTQSGMTAAADRADPYGQYRERGATNLHALEANPNSVTETPQYQFLQQQGEQGIERTAAKTGYFRSPNMLFDLSKFNQGLAAQEYNKEWERRAAEAGVNINPSTGAQIQANGVTGSNNMRAAAGSQMITQIVNSAPDFYNWLFGA